MNFQPNLVKSYPFKMFSFFIKSRVFLNETCQLWSDVMNFMFLEHLSVLIHCRVQNSFVFILTKCNNEFPTQI